MTGTIVSPITRNMEGYYVSELNAERLAAAMRQNGIPNSVRLLGSTAAEPSHDQRVAVDFGYLGQVYCRKGKVVAVQLPHTNLGLNQLGELFRRAAAIAA